MNNLKIIDNLNKILIFKPNIKLCVLFSKYFKGEMQIINIFKTFDFVLAGILIYILVNGWYALGWGLCLNPFPFSICQSFNQNNEHVTSSLLDVYFTA